MKKLIAFIVAGSIATMSLAAAPARANDAGKIFGFLVGAAILHEVVKNSNQQNQQDNPEYTRPDHNHNYGQWHKHRDGTYHRHPNGHGVKRPLPVKKLSLPQKCKRQIIIKGKRQTAYGVRCLKNRGFKIKNGTVTHPSQRYAQAKPVLVRIN